MKNQHDSTLKSEVYYLRIYVQVALPVYFNCALVKGLEQKILRKLSVSSPVRLKY